MQWHAWLKQRSLGMGAFHALGGVTLFNIVQRRNSTTLLFRISATIREHAIKVLPMFPNGVNVLCSFYIVPFFTSQDDTSSANKFAPNDPISTPPRASQTHPNVSHPQRRAPICNLHHPEAPWPNFKPCPTKNAASSPPLSPPPIPPPPTHYSQPRLRSQ